MNGKTLLAKSDGKTTLYQHLSDCAKVASHIVENSPLDSSLFEILKRDLLFCAMVHDIGKAAKGFQEVLVDDSKNWSGKRHEILSSCFASNIKNIKEEQLFAILTHHKTIYSDLATENERTLSNASHQILFKDDSDVPSPVLQGMIDEWLINENEAISIWNQLCIDLDREEWIIAKQPLMKNVGIGHEWLDRSKKYGQRAFVPKEKRKYASLLRGALISADHLSSAGITKMPQTPILKEHILYGNAEKPRPFQSKAGNICGDAILRAPTGSGKTKASLEWAAFNQNKNGRLFYVLPYTASINAMFETLKERYGDQYVGLLHHKNINYLYRMQEDMGFQQDPKLLSQLAREIYYPIKVCTPHQILRSALHGRGWEHSLIEYHNACFIFDEIHAYDPKITGLLFAMIRWLKPLGAKFLFSSATMPAFLQHIINSNLPEIPALIEPDPKDEKDKVILDLQRHVLRIWDDNIVDHMDDFLQKFHGKKMLIICNHVSTSQKIYQILLDKIDEGHYDIGTPTLLHSRFAHKDRAEIENRIIKEQPDIVVATQVIEVSLNLDYEVCLTEIAPIDALIQRFGRVNRYGHRSPEEVIVFRHQYNNHQLYPAEITEKTLDQLEYLQDTVLSEGDFVKAADVVYENGYNDAEYEKFINALNYPGLQDFDENIIAGTHKNWVEEVIESTDQIVEVLPEKYLEQYRILRGNKRWIEANMLLVQIGYKQYLNLNRRGLIRDVKGSEFSVTTAYYDKSVGLISSRMN